MLVFGPVPSRRLGFSLGINHIPPKHCTYSCIYCQVGRTTSLEIKRQEFYSIDAIISEVKNNLNNCMKLNRSVDYITLVPDGEPTLDINLGQLIDHLKKFQIPIAVISNASLIDREDVQKALQQADWVSMKVDAVDEQTWRKINRPLRSLSLPDILSGIKNFRKQFQGDLVTETMLIAGLNDDEKSLSSLIDYLLELQPQKSYISIPTRPPAESWVRPPDAESLTRILTIVDEKLPFGALLFETEGSDFISTGNLADDIISITAVHPLREEALRSIITTAGADWSIVDELLVTKKIIGLHYRGENFYCRILHPPNKV